MKRIAVRLTNSKLAHFVFVGWSCSCLAFYVRDKAKTPKLIKLSPAYPPNLDTGQPFAFPKLPPAQIFPAYLSPPPPLDIFGRHTLWPPKKLLNQAEMKRRARLFAVQWRAQFGKEHQPSIEMIENDRDVVRFCIQLEMGSEFYLRSVRICNLTKLEEVEEFTAIEHALEQKSSSSLPSAEPEWFSKDFTIVHRRSNKGVVETIPLPNTARALCLLLNDCPGKIAQYSEIEAQIGPCIHELDILAGTTKPSGKGRRRVRDLLRTQIGEQLLEWGVLKGITKGRGKFLKLCPPPAFR